jgi:transposase
VPSKCDKATIERAVRMYVSSVGPRCRARRNPPRRGILSTLTRIPADTVKGWARKYEIDAGARPGITSDQAAELKRVRRRIPS